MYIVSTGRHHIMHHGSTILHFLFATRIVPKAPRVPTGKRRIEAVPRLTAGDTPGYIMMHLCAREATILTRKLSFFQNYENNLESHSIPRLSNPLSVGVSNWDQYPGKTKLTRWQTCGSCFLSNGLRLRSLLEDLALSSETSVPRPVAFNRWWLYGLWEPVRKLG